MKKMMTMILALVMILSLTACGGGVDASKALNTFNDTRTQLNAVSTLANDNIALMDQATVDALTKIANVFEGYKGELESDKLTQKRADEILSELAAYPDQIAELKAQVEELIAAGSAEPETEAETEPETAAETEPETAAAGVASLLETVELAAVPEGLAGTGWEFAGGYINGAQMDQDQANNALAQYGGMLQIVFEDETNISMVQGGGTLAGIYGTADDGLYLSIVFDNAGTDLEYVGLFTDVNGTAVLMLSDTDGLNAIYFTQITEG